LLNRQRIFPNRAGENPYQCGKKQNYLAFRPICTNFVPHYEIFSFYNNTYG